MRNPILMLFALFCVANTSFAQVGLKAGVNIASMGQENTNISKDDIEKHSILAPVFGATLNVPVGSNFSVQTEANFEQNGGRNVYNFLGTSTEEVFRINYVNLAMLAKINLGNAAKDGGVSFHVAAGPWAGLALNGRSTVTTTIGGTDFVTKNEFTFDDQDNAKRLNYGLTGGLGLGLGHLMFDVRYNYGLNNLLDNDANNNNDGNNVLQTRGIAFTVGLVF